MVITYLGADFFKVQFGDITIAVNPISKESKLKQARFGADIALVSANHPDVNGIDLVSHGDKKPFVINGPGEYEIKGVFIKGLPSTTTYGGAQLVNSIYTVSLENMNMCFLGALDSEKLPPETVEELDEIDVLFVPIGGDGVLSPAAAYKLAVSLEPKIIIPTHYGDVGANDALKVFLKEAGESPKAEEKLTLKKKDLEGKEADIVILAPSDRS
ncbi:MAG: MBL fold metallo-hydrolase [Candidatus Pacebacteria bacterium]|nr:MBL fold metallo-hydrolase [Candidatus Paceibacterota bacterium]